MAVRRQSVGGWVLVLRARIDDDYHIRENPLSRIETIGDATLYLGDCREILPTLGKVDHVITDPPYSENTHKMAKTNRGKGHGNKLVTFDHMTDDGFECALRECLAVADGWVVLTCDYKHAALLYSWPEWVRLGAWVKPNPMPQISADRPGQGFETVAILHSGKRPKSWSRGGGSGVWTVPVNNGSEVPTQKPLGLISAFVSDFTVQGETILDPYMGSGTVGVACALADRKFVGVDISTIHFDIACRRIEAAYKQPRLFSEPTPKAVQDKLDL